jgi:hypothetical protein
LRRCRRDTALIRDGEGVQIDEDCSITAGTWLDPYTGQTLTDSSEVDIDHVVPLANAWRSGASSAAWSTADRDYWCEYARRWIWIKSDWDLSVNPNEKTALNEMLATCKAD